MPNYSGTASNADIDNIAGMQKTAAEIDAAVDIISTYFPPVFIYARMYSLGTDTPPSSITSAYTAVANYASNSSENKNVTTNLITGEMTVSEAGLYRPTFYFTQHDQDLDLMLLLYKNGVSAGNEYSATIQNTTASSGMQATAILPPITLIAGDVIKVMWKSTATDTIVWQGRDGVNLFFDIERIHH